MVDDSAERDATVWVVFAGATVLSKPAAAAGARNANARSTVSTIVGIRMSFFICSLARIVRLPREQRCARRPPTSPLRYEGEGEGEPVSVALGVGVGVAVSVGVGIGVEVSLGVGLGVSVAVGTGVPVSVALGDGLGKAPASVEPGLGSPAGDGKPVPRGWVVASAARITVPGAGGAM